MKHINTIIIGGGQAGLAVSHCLNQRNVENIVLERGRIGERWRSERWDSLRLLSPNWMARLPGFAYTGERPDDFMDMRAFIQYLEAYAESFEAPVQTGTTVTSVARNVDGRIRVATNRGDWSAANIVVATGFCDIPRIPELANKLPATMHQLAAPEYRNPTQLPLGNVLVVGASATGVQIADELRSAGREVTISVGAHVRLPRRYRGRDVLHWMVEMGSFAAGADPAQERQSPPPQLIGTPENRDLDLGTLQDAGVLLVGHARDYADGSIQFDCDVQQTIERADAGMCALLANIDRFIDAQGLDGVPPASPTRLIETSPAPSTINLADYGITSVVWATGYERRYPWLQLPALDERGEIVHTQGICNEPGLYVVGMRFQRSKGSNLIDGVGADAEYVAEHLDTRNHDLLVA